MSVRVFVRLPSYDDERAAAAALAELGHVEHVRLFRGADGLIRGSAELARGPLAIAVDLPETDR